MDDYQHALWQKLLSRSTRTGSGCLEWDGCRVKGYGQIVDPSQPRRRLRAPRAAWMAIHGPIPSGYLVCHKCDNPPCFEPSHLFLGTNAENLGDMREKGRSARGLRQHAAKLSDDQVRDIRARFVGGQGGNRSALASEFGVRPTTINEIMCRRARKYVE